LRKYENTYHNFFEKSADAMLIIENGEFVDCNAAAVAMLGYTNKEDLVHTPPFKLSPEFQPDGQSSFKKSVAMMKLAKAGGSHSFEWQHLRQNGTVIPVEVSLTAIETNVGIQLHTVWRDITERKQAEEKLWKEKAFLRSLIDSAEDLIYFKDQYSIYLGCNKASEKFTGLAEAEQVGKTDFDFFGRDFAERIVQEDQRVLAKGEALRVEEWVTTPIAGKRLLETVKTPIYGLGGQPIGLVGISRDVTARHQLEEGLRESEARFKTMFRNHGAMMLLIEPDSGAIIDANLAAEKFYGYSHEKLLSMTIGQINTLPAEAINSERQNAVDKKSGYFIFPHRIANGQLRTVEVHSTPIKNNGRALLFSIIHDISDRVKAEQEKLELEQQLLQAHKLESLGVLAGGIAHDFNNILAGLYGYISLAKTKLTKDYPDHPSCRYLEAAEKSMNRATLLSGQLLTFAKGGEPVKENVSLGTLIDEVVLFNLSGSNVKSVISPVDNLWLAKADQGQLQQVFSNLAVNAKQAMPDGGHLYISLGNADVPDDTIQDVRGGEYILITVADEGVGIPPEYLERIFEPYFTTKQTGSGLGLATVYSIIKKHGGHICATSQVNLGTTFTLYLPASEDKKALIGQAEVASQTLKKTGKILVMDDEEVIRGTVTDMLEELNFVVEAASDGPQALKLYQQALESRAPFDLVILDLTIPGGIGGKDVAQRILVLDPAAKMIVSSGYADDPVMANHTKHGFKGVIAKPYTLETLSRTLAWVLGDSWPG
jgi:PAS domain S-box-containing protein